MTALTVNDIPFIDLYVRLDQPDQALYRSKVRSESTINQLVPPEFQEAVDRFMHAVNFKLKDTNDGSIDFEGLRARLSKQKLSDDSIWVCARRINTVIPDIDKLNLQSHLCEHMKGLGRRDGLILVSGSTGHGKTTTAVGLLAYFLKTYGGAAVTIEDPVEFMLKGRHGNGGHCFQVEVRQEEEWAVNLKRALRWAPRYIYVGEIRTPKAAEQVLRAATTGHLVITTVHAGAPEEALMGLIFLAEQAMGPGVENILAAGLTGVVYQTMRESGPQIRYLYTEPDSPGDPIRSLIREKKIGMISTYIDRIEARLSHPVEGKPSQTFAPTAVTFKPSAAPTGKK
jgi:twitching motility protein PilT